MDARKAADLKAAAKAWRRVPRSVRSAPPACPRHFKNCIETASRIGMPVWTCRFEGCPTALMPRYTPVDA